MTMAPTAKYRTTPTPNPSPQGGGEHTARAAPSLMLTRRSLLAVSAAAMLAGTRPAHSEDWPQRPLHMIVPFGPGGGADIIGRIIAQSLQEKLGQGVVIENRPGAAGTLGNEAVARAEKDGYTLGIMPAVTRSAPSASTASASVSAESMPPDKPSSTPGKPFFST